MNRSVVLNYELVKSIPEKLEERTLYVSMDYATVAHKCCCGCGLEVVTPLSPTDWKLTYDGESVSLHPSIGNWSLPCQSHYWIDRSTVRWAGQWTKEQIETGRAWDRRAKEHHYLNAGKPRNQSRAPGKNKLLGRDLWSWLVQWWSRR